MDAVRRRRDAPARSRRRGSAAPAAGGLGRPMKTGETSRIRIWVDRLQSGDQSALNELIIHFERRLHALTRRMIQGYPLVHSLEQTDDVYQKAVLRLSRALKAVAPGDTRELIRLSATQIRRELLN